jgi:hypothetical protein
MDNFYRFLLTCGFYWGRRPDHNPVSVRQIALQSAGNGACIGT